MRYLTTILSVCLFLSLATVGQEASKMPLVVTPASWDWGTIRDDVLVSHTFVIKNEGAMPVTLTPLPSPCDCIISRPDPDLVPAGGEAKLHVQFYPKGKRGRVNWEVALKTDLPGTPKLLIHLSSFVLRDAILSDEVINFGVFKRDSKKTMSLWIVCREHPDFLLKEVKCTAEGFQTKIQEQAEVIGFYPGPLRGYQVDIIPDDAIAYGRNYGNLMLTTDIPGHETMELRLFAYIIGEITAAPDYLAFGVVKPGMSLRRNIKVSHNDYQEFEIVKLATKVPFLKAELKTVLPKKYYEINVTLDYPEKPEAGEFRGQLEIYTDCLKHSVVTVYVQGFIQTETGQANPDSGESK